MINSYDDEEERYIHESYNVMDRLSSNLANFSLLSPDAPYIFILIKDQFTVAGEYATAEILLNIPSSLGRVDLFLTSQGFEELRIFKSLKLLSLNSNKIYNINTIIRTWDNLEAGNYIIPVTFKLPHYVPSTFVYSGEDTLKNYIKAEIFYMISARLVYEDSEALHSRPINVKSSQYRNVVKFEYQTIEPVNGKCCSNKGNLKIKLESLNEEHCTCLGSISYQVTPNNSECSLPVIEVASQIVRSLTFVDKNRIYNIQDVVSSINRTVWVAANSELFMAKDFCFTHDLNCKGEEMNSSTVDSIFIKCEYSIDLSIKYTNLVKKSNLEFYVNSAIKAYKDTPSLPMDWKGQIHPLIKLVIETD